MVVRVTYKYSNQWHFVKIFKKNGILFHFIYINYFYLNNSTISNKILKLDFIRELFSLN